MLFGFSELFSNYVSQLTEVFRFQYQLNAAIANSNYGFLASDEIIKSKICAVLNNLSTSSE